jgi:hypothetical protein
MFRFSLGKTPKLRVDVRCHPAQKKQNDDDDEAAAKPQRTNNAYRQLFVLREQERSSLILASQPRLLMQLVEATLLPIGHFLIEDR